MCVFACCSCSCICCCCFFLCLRSFVLVLCCAVVRFCRQPILFVCVVDIVVMIAMCRKFFFCLQVQTHKPQRCFWSCLDVSLFPSQHWQGQSLSSCFVFDWFLLWLRGQCPLWCCCCSWKYRTVCLERELFSDTFRNVVRCDTSQMDGQTTDGNEGRGLRVCGTFRHLCPVANVSPEVHTHLSLKCLGVVFVPWVSIFLDAVSLVFWTFPFYDYTSYQRNLVGT